MSSHPPSLPDKSSEQYRETSLSRITNVSTANMATHPGGIPAAFFILAIIYLLSPVVRALPPGYLESFGPQRTNTALQGRRCADTLTFGKPTARKIQPCCCWYGLPFEPQRFWPIQIPIKRKTLYNIPAIISEACGKLSTYEFGLEPYVSSATVEVENKLDGTYASFNDSIQVSAMYWRNATRICNKPEKLTQEECEADFRAAICDEGRGIGYGKCFEFTLDTNPSHTPYQSQILVTRLPQAAPPSFRKL
ncbi:hypothetical protein Q7P37_000357 [Cladosporium fusiforme]